MGTQIVALRGSTQIRVADDKELSRLSGQARRKDPSRLRTPIELTDSNVGERTSAPQRCGALVQGPRMN
ncbi:MAG TPA: hypothetical protein VFP15_01630 [Gemmatimonadaceae bacterium]|nr:hypothetical protein [Gemmatimonadaceae bacterium]